MYDGAVSHLDLQPIIPLTSEIEMKSDLNAILVMMKKDKTYRELFKVSLMTVPFLLRTCSKHFQFMVMLTSSNSKLTITGAMKAVPSLLTSSWKYFV
jgi:cytochrome c peroxidase